MRLPVKILLGLNKLFPPRPHPFNLANEGKLTYHRWQYEKGADTVAYFAPDYSPEDIFRGKEVLDMGCGAAGKDMYYLSVGARHVTGLDMLEKYKSVAEDFAKELGCADRFTFLLGNAMDTGLPAESFDVVVMNDFLEHVSDPEAALREALRVLRPGGRIFTNVPPYYHPTGAHLLDEIGVPWVHILFSEQTCIEAYKELIRGLPDEQERIAFRFGIGEDGKEHITYINHLMTIRYFRNLLKKLDLKPVYYKEIPLRPWVAPLAKLPGSKELFVKMMACVIEK